MHAYLERMIEIGGLYVEYQEKAYRSKNHIKHIRNE
jgi:hypothetical protein